MKYIFSEMPGVPATTRLIELLTHLEAWDISIIGITPDTLDVDGAIPEDQLAHLGLTREGG